MALCWKCQMSIKEYETLSGVLLYPQPDRHCHHDEPEEKPKCKCNNSDFMVSTMYFQSEITSPYHRTPFCPECGRKLS